MPLSAWTDRLSAVTDATLHYSQELTWLEPGHGSVLQTLSARRGRRMRTIRATADGHHQWTRRPKDKKQGKSLQEALERLDEAVKAWEAKFGEVEVPANTVLP